MPLLTFVIPVRHQDNALDWGRSKANLSQTVASIGAQEHGDWQAIIVANEGADLPPLPERFRIERVSFPPNRLHQRKGLTAEEFYDAFRIDKGRRVLTAMLAAPDSAYFMVVDDDDFVSARLTGFVAANAGQHGWVIEHGYVWTEGGVLLLCHDRFDKVCGTSLVVRADSYQLPAKAAAADADFVKRMLGSHRDVAAALAERGRPLSAVPFRGAIYRVGNAGSHSQTPGLLRRYVLQDGQFWRHPAEFVRTLGRLRLVGRRIRREFFGEAP